MTKTKCGLCYKELSFWNQPLLKKLNLTSGERICSTCFMKVNRKSPSIAFNIRKYSLPEIKNLLNIPTNNGKSRTEIQFNITDLHKTQTPEIKVELDDYEKKYPKWYGSENIKGLCFERDRLEPLPVGQIEKVHYKTNRYAELFGRGKDVSYFPGYGNIYNRTFEIWFRNKGSRDKEGTIEYKDIGIDKYYGPFFAEKFTGGLGINNELERTSGYIKLFNVRDNKSGKTWYAGLKNIEFTGIITDKEVD
ncbi:MAG: hypothetical protein AB7O73_15630 [Bacteroidia bacterium]